MQGNNIQVKKSDAAWNYFSFVIMGASGILFNFIIAHFYDSTALGVFNQAFAFYIIASQFCVLGVHYSVLSKVATATETEVGTLVVSGLMLTLCLGVVFSTGLYLSKDFIGNVLQSPQVAQTISYVAPATMVFGVNKTLLNALNGLNRMRQFAIGQSLRYLAILSTLLFLSFNEAPTTQLASVFLVAELILFLFLVISLLPTLAKFSLQNFFSQTKDHLIFGAKGFLSGVLVEFNSRIDVLMLGIFLSDSVVGIYSFAAFFAEGLFQVLVVLRNLINPHLAKALKESRLDEIKATFRKWKPKVLLTTLGSSILCLVVYSFYSQLAAWENQESFYVLAILLIGITGSSAFVPFDGLFVQGQRPELQSLQMLLIVITNILLNALFIPIWGVFGAAAATSASFLFGALYLIVLARKFLNVNLI